MGHRKKIKKEEIAEDWCFVCKDGGDVRICDYKQCIKSYHPACVDQEASFLDSKTRFVCSRHNCVYCGRYSALHCYTCPHSLCRQCIANGAEDFTQVKGVNGFCSTCLKLVLLVEEGMDYDSDGERVDFTDRNSVEGLFMEYYVIIKKEQGFELNDIHAAKNKLKTTKDSNPGYSSEEFYESEEDQVSDYDDYTESQKKRRKTQNGKKSIGQSSSKTPLKSSKMEFVGWGSKPLIDFLSSIGKSTTEIISQHEVTSIVNEYIKENKLFADAQKRKGKFVDCDTRLQSLFKKKMISKFRISDLLEPHFAENHDDSEEDKPVSDLDKSNLRISQSKSKKMLDVEKKCQKKVLRNGVSHTGFASIVVENIKLVYLRRSLIYELLKERESFEEKVIGSFVRIKTDPYDCTTTNSHQLMQVKGVKPASEGESNGEIVLLFPTIYGESRVSLLSDDNISEAECEDLEKKMVAGLLKRPTVVELEQKAKVLHEDITEHWIIKELSLLKRRIERANEKGWRRELAEYLEERKKLQTPSERKRLLDTVPTVIPETISDPNHSSDDNNADLDIDEDSPKSGMLVLSEYLEERKKLQTTSAQKRLLDTVSTVIPATTSEPNHSSDDNNVDLEINEDSPKSDDKTLHVPSFPPEKQTLATGSHFVHDNKFNKPLQCSGGKKDKIPKSNGSEEKAKLSSQKGVKSQEPSSTYEVVDLVSDDEDGAHKKFDGIERSKWRILGPRGERHECYLTVLKRWSNLTTYAFEFKVWREDEDEEDAIPLGEAIRLLPE